MKNFWKDLIKDPLITLGFENRIYPGTVDHGKLMSTAVLFYLMGMCARYNEKLTLSMSIVMGSLALGRAAWGRFLESKVVRATETISKTIKIAESFPRDEQEGVQPYAGQPDELEATGD